nr:reverse transcriptase domain-containing protein [Tanacetum cinerariifolium]
MPEPGPEAQNRGAVVPNHRGRKVQKGERCSKDWRKVCFIGWETRRRMCLHIQEAQNESHTTVVAGTHKAATKALEVKPKKQKLSMEDDLSQPWVCEETDPFTPRIYYFDFPKTRMPSHIKTYDESEDPEDHLKIFQAAAKTERWAMPNWCHMFNSTLTENARVWFDDLPKESIDSYDDLRKEFLENYLQQKKCIKDPVEIHNIKQRNGESTKEFVRRYKLECRDVKGAPECMKISGFMHEITNLELIKRLHDKIPKSMDEMMSVTTTFLRGEMAVSNRERNKVTLLTKTPREILALDKGKFKPPLSMTTPVEKRNASKFCEFHGEVGHTTDECMHLKRQIKEMLKAGKLLHLIKELKQNYGKDQAKIEKKGETLGKDKPLAILMVQPWQKIESKFHPEIKNQLISANTPLVGFSGEIIWPLGQISLLVRVGDEEHSTSTRMNFMVVRSSSPYNGIIGRPRVRKIRAIPSITHEMIKFPVAGGIVTLQSSRIIQLECSMVSEPGIPRSAINQVREEKIQVAIHLKHPEQTIALGSTLTEEGRKELCGLLRRHLDVFAWKPADMTGVPRHIAKHRLNVREGCLPVRQKKRGQAAERNKAISEEVKKLVEAGIMKEVHYHRWLSNPVMVKKHEDSWRIVTYQRLVNKAFQKQIGCNLEVYMDDLVIKSQTEKEMIRDTKETFRTLRKINMKLNPKKCAFGMREGTLLGYKVDADGPRVSPEKVKAVIDLTSPKCLKDVQKLNGKLAKGAFKEMKQSIAELLMLTVPKEKEELIMYLEAAKEAINAVLMIERDGKQVPAYFVSRALQGPKINYTPMEKLILALYRPRTSVKRQILADFIGERLEDGAPDTLMEDREELPDLWILFTDGSSCVDGSRAGLIIMNPEGMEFTYALRFRFNATNNEAEYEALIAGLRIATQMGIQNLQANVDSKLVANQVNEIYIAKESSMIRNLEKVKNLANTFKGFFIKQIPKRENKKADALRKITSTSFAHLSKQVLVEELRKKAIDEKEIPTVVEEEEHTWMTPVYEYLTEWILPEEKKKARTVRRKAGRYAVINEVLYKKNPSLVHGCGVLDPSRKTMS